MAGSLSFPEKAGPAMRRLLLCLAAAGLLAGLGCTNEKDKGIYSNRDRPTAEPRRPAERDKPATEPRGSEPDKRATEPERGTEPAKGTTQPRRDSGR
jgi:hypothetical protein